VTGPETRTTTLDAARPRPVARGERLLVLDVLRGFAITGILWVNVPLMFAPVYGAVLGSGPQGTADAWARLWWGDILIYYGVLGLFLLPLRRASPGRILRWAALALAVPIVLGGAFAALTGLAAGPAEAQLEEARIQAIRQARAGEAAALEAYRRDDVAAMARQRFSDWTYATIGVTTLAYGYGAGWYGEVGPAAALAVTAAVLAVQVPLSVLWTRRFRYGPAEGLWRTLSYGRRPR